MGAKTHTGTGWRPIATAPKGDAPLLGVISTTFDDQEYAVIYWSAIGYNEEPTWCCGRNDLGEHIFREHCEPTHWMPLPPLPLTDDAQAAAEQYDLAVEKLKETP